MRINRSGEEFKRSCLVVAKVSAYVCRLELTVRVSSICEGGLYQRQ